MKEFFEKVKAFFKSLWQKILANKVVSIAVAAVLVVGISTAIVVISLSGGGKPPVDSSDSSVETSQEVETCTITFESNGGTKISSIKVDVGSVVDLNQYVPVKDNNYFYGWCSDAELTTRVDGFYTAEGNVTLYAEWGAEEMYVLSFETNGGTVIESVSYRPNAYLLEPAEPTKENYSFGGWYKDAACTKQFSFFTAPQMPKGNLTIYAKWNALNGFIFETNGGSAVAPVYGTVGEPIDEIATPTMENKVFEGWYSDAALKNAYEPTVIPKGIVTLYAKWHDQAKNIAVTLHFNYQGQDAVVTVSGNEGEALNDAEVIADFTADITLLLKSSYLGEESALADKPIYNFSAWAYDAKGSQRFDGKLPHVQTMDLYAVWSRSAAYCQVSFVNGDNETAYYVDKNTEIDASILDAQTTDVKNVYEARGCTVDGFYTTSGSSYKAGDKIAMDMRLIPYVYTSNLAYNYTTIMTNLGAEVKGYALTGYDATGAENNADKDNLLLLVPEYYNDGKNGQLPVVWVAENAFKDYKVSEVTLPDSVYGIGANAFSGTTVTTMSLPSKLYYIGDNAFTNSTLQTVTYNSSVTQIGITVFAGTDYENTLPTDKTETDPASYIFFDEQGKIIYKYVGTETVGKTPSTAQIIAGGAFMNNQTLQSLELSNSIRQVGDYAFANSKLQSVKIGQGFGGMGVGIFKDCASLKTVEFTFKYNLAALGTSMFEGCTALTDINLSFLDSLKTVENRAFYGCSALTSVAFGDSLVTVGESAFENCTSLVYADFGKVAEEGSLSKLATINKRAFAGCTSLKRVILRGELIGNTIVQFKANVFEDAGYTKNGRFVTPVIYVKDTYVDHWSNDDEDGVQVYSYVEMYKMYLPTEYKNFVVKAIDAKAPEVASNGIVSLKSDASLASFDLLTYLKDNNAFLYQDDHSLATDCEVYVVEVYNAAGATLTATNGKYNLQAVGQYLAVIAVEDEFGNRTDVQVYIQVNA